MQAWGPLSVAYLPPGQSCRVCHNRLTFIANMQADPAACPSQSLPDLPTSPQMTLFPKRQAAHHNLPAPNPTHETRARLRPSIARAPRLTSAHTGPWAALPRNPRASGVATCVPSPPHLKAQNTQHYSKSSFVSVPRSNVTFVRQISKLCPGGWGPGAAELHDIRAMRVQRLLRRLPSCHPG